MSFQELSWQTYAIAAMGAIVLAVSGLWVNGVLNNIELVRVGISRQSEEDRKTYSEQIDTIKSDFQRMYSDFGTVRNEQMQRTGRLTALETKLEIVIPTMEKRLGSLEADMNALEAAVHNSKTRDR